MSVLEPVSARRRRTDAAARGLLAASALIVVIPLVLILYYVARKGLGTWNAEFFTKDPTNAFLGDPGGIRSAILGTLEIVGLATLISVPFGIGVALYLVEYGRGSRLAGAVRYFIDVMTGVPSIVFGLFVYVVLIEAGGFGTFAGWKASVALSLLMLPIVTRSAEVVLLLVPDSLREAALALGARRWRVTLRVVLPTALPGLITGSLLAIARGAGETAPLLFTTAVVADTTFNLGERMNALPTQIFVYLQEPSDQLVARAWGAALTLVLLVLALTLLARLVSRRTRLA